MTEKINIKNLLIEGSRVVVLILLFLIFTIFTKNFFGIGNTTNVVNLLLQQAPFMIMIALGQTMVMILGGIDLSVGANISLSSFICAMIIQANGSSVLGIGGSLITGICIGVINGLLVSKIGLPPFVATYSMDWIVKGVALVVSKGGQITGFDNYRALFNSFRGTYLIIALVLIVVMIFIFNKTTYGRKIYSVGCNPAAAKLSGINESAVTISVYALAGLVAAITGLMYIANLGAAEPTLGGNFTMQSMAAAMIGGASFAGARSKISHALVGGLILVVLTNGMIHIGVPGVWQDVAQGIVIVAAVIMERVLEKLRAAG